MSDAPLLTEIRGAVMIVTINDAPWNRMSAAFMDELEALVGTIAQDESIRAVVLTGAGDKNFSVGMNLKEIGTAVQAKGGQDAFFDQRWNVISAIENMGKPWVPPSSAIAWAAGWNSRLGAIFVWLRRKGARSACRRWIWGLCLPGAAVRGFPVWSVARMPST